MPLVRVELFERRLTPELEARLIDRLTETLVETLEAPELKSHTWVIVEGHDAHRWGRNARAVTARGERVRHDTIAGRTTAWVRAVQR